MAADARYLSVADVIALHQTIMERMGSPGTPLRDEGLLESALMRPRAAAFYEQADLVCQAALLVAGISQAQAFVDGNKRVAFAALYAFLYENGLAYAGESLEVARAIEALATRADSVQAATARFEQWLRGRVVATRLDTGAE